jgi:type IV pilus assembly protein PilY1
MHRSQQRLSSLLVAAFALIGGATTPPAIADDSEVFTSSAFTSGAGARPNILFVVDTSGSMAAETTSYDPTRTYTGPCPADRVYWRTENTWEPPSCASNQWIAAAQNTCNASAANLTNVGAWRGRSQQFNPATNQWGNLRAGASADPMECSADSGIHGPFTGSPNRWARNNATRWTNAAGGSINWAGRPSYTYYSVNYMNWWYGTEEGSRATRWEVVRDVAKNLIDELEGVNLGLMRYSNNQGTFNDAYAEGGMVMHPVIELTAANKTTLKNLLDAWGPDGYTPLSETLYEATQYFRGAPVDYGNTSRLNGWTTAPSVAGSRVGGSLANNTYNSPIDFNCQNNYIVYLTDGLPTWDAGANAKIPALPDFAEHGGSCATTDPDPSWPESGRCMVALARYLNTADINPAIIGRQSVKTYMIGFGDDIVASRDFLDDIAEAGGTREAYTANSVGSLSLTLQEIFTNILEGKDVTFVSPTLSVNAFNRTRNLNDLYVSVFSPARGLHWPGNLKKYEVRNGLIVDANGRNAIDPETGFFSNDARSFWSVDAGGTPIVDGAEVTLGGAASRLPEYNVGVGGRKLYTFLGGNVALHNGANSVEPGNAALTDALLGLGAPGDPTRDNLIAFARGQDIQDIDRDGNTTERRLRLGDAMHAKPALVIYGGTEAAPEGVVYTPTNDGYLHAFDSQTGEELWAFIPPEFLPRLKRLYEDPVTPEREYALDGEVTVFKYDVDGDGRVEPAAGDKVYLFFGFGRGGQVYYALDVTTKTQPRFLWKKDATNLPALGKTWSPPTITRVDVSGSGQSAQRLVLIFGGGYDDAQDNYVYTTDSIGNRIFMLDVEDGDLLWYAGDNAGANLQLPEMNNSIPSRVTVIDVNNDGLADRMYVGDMGGRVWRFDIWNGQSASSLVTGGVFARLGAGGIAGAPRAAARRFYNAPDVVLMQPRGAPPYYNLAIGSGYRGHPLENETQDRFYSLRDYAPFTKRTQAQYASFVPAVDGGLVDVTTNLNATVANGSRGWKLLLNDAGSWLGEKVLAESLTVDGVILFPTFIPLGEDPSNPCTARMVNRAYAIRIENGRPYDDRNNDGAFEHSDRYTVLRQSGIAPEITVINNNSIVDDGGGDPPAVGGGPPVGGGDPPPRLPTSCKSGGEPVQGRCPGGGSGVRTYWQRR